MRLLRFVELKNAELKNEQWQGAAGIGWTGMMFLHLVSLYATIQNVPSATCS
jgi:hypothetical protein